MDIQHNESYVEHAETLLSAFAVTGNVGAFLVDIFPIMKMIPEWFPGAGWKRKASLWRSINAIVANSLWDSVKEQVVNLVLLFVIEVLTTRTECGDCSALCGYGYDAKYA
jgi:hypothetical protein